ncbi:MAG: L,D-transpeptidase family protein [Sphingomicrobium sp.]
MRLMFGMIPKRASAVKSLVTLGFWALASASVGAPRADDSKSMISQRAAALGPGQYVWETARAQTGPLLLTIDLTAQRLMVYRDGALIAASTISTGSAGRETTTGVFTILEKKVMHRSSTYDDAPMPYMQRLTSKGIAIHAGDLPGYAASHGCIRLPNEFAKQLYGVTEIGTPVMITDDAEIAEQKRIAAEYARAHEDYVRRTIEQRTAAARTWSDFQRAKAAHEKIRRQHEADMAKYKSEISSE